MDAERRGNLHPCIRRTGRVLRNFSAGDCAPHDRSRMRSRRSHPPSLALHRFARHCVCPLNQRLLLHQPPRSSGQRRRLHITMGIGLHWGRLTSPMFPEPLACGSTRKSPPPHSCPHCPLPELKTRRAIFTWALSMEHRPVIAAMAISVTLLNMNSKRTQTTTVCAPAKWSRCLLTPSRTRRIHGQVQAASASTRAY